MLIRKVLFSALCLLGSLPVFSQASQDLVWHTPSLVHGQVTQEGTAKYGRLPDALKDQVRTPVWHLGTNSAGLHIDFTTDAETVVVRYKVKGAVNMPHMPSTGVSGVDLYMHDKGKNNWSWTAGKYSFTDTITYTFKEMGLSADRVYQLYLPLYNTVEWLEIGIPANNSLTMVDSKQKPIIVYGTSIAHGACATRPGLAWTNMLGRDLGMPVINLAFSGNGRLEEPILNLIAKADPSVIVLDCLPNLSITAERTEAQLDSLIYTAFTMMRKAHPNTPIILNEHSAGFNESVKLNDVNRRAEQTTLVGRRTFARLKKEGFKQIYLLTNKEVGLDLNSTVDYVHPNDIGMRKIADAYAKLLKKVL